MMIPPPLFLDAEHRKLEEFQKRAHEDLVCAFVKEVVG